MKYFIYDRHMKHDIEKENEGRHKKFAVVQLSNSTGKQINAACSFSTIILRILKL